jgi:hypothetical protein
MTFHEQYAIAAATTLAVELPVVLLVVRRARLMVPDLHVLGAALLANLLTHPVLWYLPYFAFRDALAPGNYGLYLVVGEGLTLLLEFVVYWALLVRHRPWLAMAMSALANAASYGAGLLLWQLLR